MSKVILFSFSGGEVLMLLEILQRLNCSWSPLRTRKRELTSYIQMVIYFYLPFLSIFFPSVYNCVRKETKDECLVRERGKWYLLDTLPTNEDMYEGQSSSYGSTREFPILPLILD